MLLAFERPNSSANSLRKRMRSSLGVHSTTASIDVKEGFVDILPNPTMVLNREISMCRAITPIGRGSSNAK